MVPRFTFMDTALVTVCIAGATAFGGAVVSAFRATVKSTKATTQFAEELRATREMSSRNENSLTERDRRLEERLKSMDELKVTVIRMEERQRHIEEAIRELRADFKGKQAQ